MFIDHDMHIHTHYSPCADATATAEHYIQKAHELSLKKIGFADHMWDSAVECTIPDYRKLTYEHISQIKEEVKALNAGGIEILFGCETECDKNGTVAVSEEVAEKLDFLIVPQSHTHLTMPKDCYEPHRKHAEFMLERFYNIVESPVSKYVTTIPHPFCAVACPYDNRELVRLITDQEFSDCFCAAKEKNIAVEINAGAFAGKSIGEIRTDPMLHMLSIAKSAGCKFVFGSDSHRSTGHDGFFKNYVIACLLELKPENIAEFAR